MPRSSMDPLDQELPAASCFDTAPVILLQCQRHTEIGGFVNCKKRSSQLPRELSKDRIRCARSRTRSRLYAANCAIKALHIDSEARIDGEANLPGITMTGELAGRLRTGIPGIKVEQV